jgi:hypothetical protein
LIPIIAGANCGFRRISEMRDCNSASVAVGFAVFAAGVGDALGETSGEGDGIAAGTGDGVGVGVASAGVARRSR